MAPLHALTPRSSAPALVLLLALAVAFLLGSDPDRWTPGTNNLITANHMTVAGNLSPEHRFLGFYEQRLDDEGRRYYVPYNRFPVFGHLLIKLVTLPFPDDGWARLRAARLLMLALHAAAAALAWLALRRLARDPWTALAATLLAFSSSSADSRKGRWSRSCPVLNHAMRGTSCGRGTSTGGASPISS